MLIPLGIVPAIFTIYLFTANYEGKYKEKSIFISFLIGMILGMIIYIIEMSNISKIMQSNLYIGDVIIFSLLFSFLEQISKLMVLNMKFLNDIGLPLYGASMGAGFASPFAPVFIREIVLTGYNLLIIIIPILIIFLESYTGILIGSGIRRNEKAKYFLYALSFYSIIWILLILIFYFKTTFYFFPLFILLILITISSFYHSFKKLIPFNVLSRHELKKFL